MKRRAIALLGAAGIATLAASTAAEAAIIDFGVAVADGAPTYMGTSLDMSNVLDLDQSTLLVVEKGADDASGLPLFSTITLTADTSPASSEIIYGFGTGPSPLGADVVLSWTGSTGDTFTETLTTVTSISRAMTNQIGMTLTGTVSDADGVFTDAPVLVSLTANQANGPGEALSISFTHTSSFGPAIPEPSTWVMMGLGFGALGYAARRQRKTMLTA
jgi:hypothetical protein